MAPYKKRVYYRRGNRDKYSIEQCASQVVVPAAGAQGPGQGGVVVVPPTDLQGMRKVKHLTVSLAQPGLVTTQNGPTSVYWCLVYVPQGTSVGQIVVGSGGSHVPMYEPNQFVMNCGVVDFEAGPVRITSPLSRNLNSGDQIALVLANNSSQSAIGVDAVCRYAVTLQ